MDFTGSKSALEAPVKSSIWRRVLIKSKSIGLDLLKFKPLNCWQTLADYWLLIIRSSDVKLLDFLNEILSIRVCSIWRYSCEEILIHLKNFEKNRNDLFQSRIGAFRWNFQLESTCQEVFSEGSLVGSISKDQVTYCWILSGRNQTKIHCIWSFSLPAVSDIFSKNPVIHFGVKPSGLLFAAGLLISSVMPSVDKLPSFAFEKNSNLKIWG